MKKPLKYKGHLITKKCGFYWTLGRMCKTIKEAKQFINSNK